MVHEGDTRRLTIRVMNGPHDDPNSQPIDPDEIELTIREPSGAIVTKTRNDLVSESPGQFVFFYTFAEPGEYEFRVASTKDSFTEVTPMTVYVEASKV